MSWATHISMMATDTKESPETSKKLAFADRSGAFCFNLNILLKLSSLESLRFISEMAERMESADSDLENDDCPFNPYQKLIINPEQLDPITADIDRFFLWCDNNISEVSKVFRHDGYDEDDIKQGMTESAYYTIDQFDSDLSGAPDFLFCALKSMQGLLKYAKDNHMPVTYENLAEC